LFDSIQLNQLRLLRFIQDGDYTSATFETFSIEESLPPYYALSYTWASDKKGLAKSWALRIECRQLPVLDSLKPFVEVLRNKGMLMNGSWWWIDSLCIDQTRLEERAQQVQLMQHIYHRAYQVVIWLREESIDSDLAVDFIKSLDKISRKKYNLKEIRTMLQTEQHYPQWKALTNFLARKWWSRIWTVQEFVIPLSVSFWCGTRNVGRTAVCRGLEMADQCTSVGIKETNAFRYGFNRRRAWELYKAGKSSELESSRSLLALTAYFSCMDATDDRDRLYGLMALCTDSSLLDISYSLSSQEVYLRFTKAFIRRHKSLDVICFASTHSMQLNPLQPS
jgi:hypothetical protein